MIAHHVVVHHRPIIRYGEGVGATPSWKTAIVEGTNYFDAWGQVGDIILSEPHGTMFHCIDNCDNPLAGTGTFGRSVGSTASMMFLGTAGKPLKLPKPPRSVGGNSETWLQWWNLGPIRPYGYKVTSGDEFLRVMANVVDVSHAGELDDIARSVYANTTFDTLFVWAAKQIDQDYAL